MKTFALQTRALAAAALLFSIAPLPAAPVEWTVASGGNGHTYDVILFPNGIPWAAAQTDALTRGGHLATLLSLAENNFAFGLPNGNLSPWLGGFQPPGSIEPAGGWQWVNGEGPFDFTNWGSGEPNNFGGEDSLHFRGDGLWNDASGTTSLGAYVLEIEPKVPTNGVPEGGSALALLSIALFAVEGVRRKLAAR
jgi:hypothetical protein